MANPVLDYDDWLKCSAFLTAATGRAMDAKQIEVYYELLSDIPFDALKVACRRAVQENDASWMPPIGLIRKHAADEMFGSIPAWSDEWEHVRALVHSYGIGRQSEAYRQMSPMTQQAVTAVGWSSICDSEIISLHATQFQKAYESLASRESSTRRISVDLRPRITSEAGMVSLPSQQRPLARIAQELAARMPSAE